MRAMKEKSTNKLADKIFDNERHEGRPFIRKSDLFFVAIIFFISFLFLTTRTRSSTESDLSVQIYYKNELVFEEKLAELSIGEFTLDKVSGFVFQITDDGGIFIKKAPCRDQICVAAGHLKKHGDMAICVPSQLIVKLSGKTGQDQGVDLVVGKGGPGETK